MRNVGFVCAPWQLKMLADRKGESDLIFRDGSFYLHATVDTDAPDQVVPADDPTGWLGVDLGIVNLAVTTADDPAELDVRWSGGAVTARRKKNETMRSALQKVGTKSAKRKLKKRRRKETRYATDINHQLSKTIVAQAQRTGQGIALEDLSGIRDRVRLARNQRQQLHSWAYAGHTYPPPSPHGRGASCCLVDPGRAHRPGSCRHIIGRRQVATIGARCGRTPLETSPNAQNRPYAPECELGI